MRGGARGQGKKLELMLWEADGPRASEAVLGQLRARLESARKMLVAVTEQLQAPARPGRGGPRTRFGVLGPALISSGITILN